jgi:hypothetical protein
MWEDNNNVLERGCAKVWTGSAGSSPMVGFCEYGHKPLRFI